MMIATRAHVSPPPLETLAALHYEGLFRFAVSLCGTPEGAFDLTQQTFYLAIRRFEQLREPGKLKSWLFSILFREFLQLKRHTSKFRHFPIDDCGAELPRVHHASDYHLDAAAVREALAEVPELYREPLTLYYLHELSYREISLRLQVPMGTVMSRLSRGKELLRAQLEPRRRRPQNFAPPALAAA